MQANLHHALQWMQHEKTVAGHWCSLHLVHDYHFWLFLLIAVTIIAFIALIVSTGGGTLTDQELRYYAYPYSAF